MNLFFFNNFFCLCLLHLFLFIRHFPFNDDHDFNNLFSTNHFENINFPQLLDWWCYCCFGFFSLSATARILCSSTDPGVAGITTGAAYPLRANQFRFYSFFSRFLSTFR